MNQQKKVFITGGHITPALALIEELETQQVFLNIMFIGRKYAMEGDTHTSEEYRLITEKGIPFFPLGTGRLGRTVDLSTFFSLFKIPMGFIQALVLCIKEKPSVIVSFGGYVALPVVIAGWVLRIPTITHEQTTVPGLANRIIALFARRICVSFPQTMSVFPKEKVVYTGLPIRKALFENAIPLPFSLDPRYPLLYILGGATGAKSLNELFYPVIGSLTNRYTVVHQTGHRSYDEAAKIKESLPVAHRGRYCISPYVDEKPHASFLKNATLIIGRSGANTVGELSVLGKVALCIPLPWSAGGEQLHNAEVLSHAGSAKILDQHALSSQQLLSTIDVMIQEHQRYARHARSFAKTVPHDGARLLAHELSLLLS